MSSINGSSINGSVRKDNGKPIPQPKETFLLGNVPDLDPKVPLRSLIKLAKIHGPIYQLRVPGQIMVIVSSQEMIHAVCDETKFEKVVSGPLEHVRDFAGDSLFTAHNHEPNWALAHRILVPAFRPTAIRQMQPMMMDVLAQMVMYWEHHAGQPFEAAEQFTRLTFDTIGLTAFKYRFNSFNRENPHDFLTAMTKLLGDAYTRSRRPGVVNKLMYREEAEYKSNIALLHRTCDEIVAARRKLPDPEAGDLLNRMINDKDPETGARLPDDNIRYQMVTFLIAGHETTSGTLAFTVYYLLKNPATLRKAREEADAAVKDAGGNLAAINPTKLPYLDAVLKEALRLQTTATFWTRAPKEDVELPGGYFLKKGQSIGVVPHCLHRDPKAWGADAEEFRPERWLEGTVFPPDSWKPFGNGARACIGQLFAMQEGLLALAVVLHRFDLDFADKGYDLKIKMGITIQPDGFRIVAKPRQGRKQSLISELLAARGTATSTAPIQEKTTLVNGTAPSSVEAKDKLVFLYGSNSATCETLALELAAEGVQRGYGTKAAALDAVAKDGKLPTDERVVICTPSYEGLPPGNGRLFVEAITKEQDKAALKGVRYAVFGAGHHDWPRTFHKVPKLIDTRLEELGAQRFLPLSLADAGGDIVDDIETFKSKLWEALGGSSGSTDAASSQPLSVQVVPSSVNPTAALLSAGVDELGTVVSQTTLVEPEADRRKKVHTTIRLAEGCPYRAGDYLAVLPKNPPTTVSRALARLGLESDSVLTLESGAASPHLPRETPIRAGDLLESYVELGQQVSKRTLSELAPQCQGDDAKVVQALADENNDEIVTKRLSLLDVLEKISEHKPNLAFFLESLHKMKIRQYSISSTPLADPSLVTLTYDIHSSPSDPAHGLGAASNYLSSLIAGQALRCDIKSSVNFHLPTDSVTPVVFFAAGTGLAPFMGFAAERAMLKSGGRQVGETILYYGCRDRADMMHAEQLLTWASHGSLDLRPVFSRAMGVELPAPVKVVDAKYVQDRVWMEREELRTLYKAGAMFYTCASGSRMALDLKKTLIKIIMEAKGCSEEEAGEKMDSLAQERYRTDVFV